MFKFQKLLRFFYFNLVINNFFLFILQILSHLTCCAVHFPFCLQKNAFLLFVARCLELCIKVTRKRLQRVGGTLKCKSELDDSSYAEFYQEHDGNLTLDVWWPNHE